MVPTLGDTLVLSLVVHVHVRVRVVYHLHVWHIHVDVVDHGTGSLVSGPISSCSFNIFHATLKHWE